MTRALVGGAVAAGVVAGYLAERAAMRPRLSAPEPAGPPLGSIEGDRSEVRGPDGLRINVETHGPEGAPQVVFAHGWVCSTRVWHEQVVGLGDRVRLVTYDQPGHGMSSDPRSGEFTIDLFGDTLAAVLEQATDPGPVVLCGHSLGGMSILNALRRHPHLRDRVSSVLLLSTASRAAADDVRFGFGIHSVARFEAFIRRVLHLGGPGAPAFAARVYAISTDLSFLLTREFGLWRGAQPRYVDFTEQLLLDSDFHMVTGVIGPLLQLDEDEALECIGTRTVVLCGSEDWLTPVGLSRRMAERCEPAELIELPGVGHMTPLEAAPTVNAVLAEMIAAVPQRVGA
ncbi:MAG: alpha/beta hydrolase [Nitriliruptorales bacterium]|nr:alpha/beta hydrolase [Nitriliruptorales bacterium]